MSLGDLFEHFTAKPKTITWIIDNFENSSYANSPRIELSSSKLPMYLNLHSEYYGVRTFSNDVVITFIIDPNYHSSIYYRISLINEKGQKCNTQVGRAKSGFNGHYFFTRDYLLDETNNLLPDGNLTIECEVYEFNEDESAESCVEKDNLVSLSLGNQLLLASGKLSDFVVAVGEREFKAHKLILSTRSVVFEKMFKHDLEESKRNRVEITDMSAGAVEDLLKFIYTGKVSDLEKHVYELFVAADKYQIDSLKTYCELYLSMSISTSTIPAILQFVDDCSEQVLSVSLTKLKSKCINYITRHKREFNYDEWKELTIRQSALMLQVWQAGNELK